MEYQAGPKKRTTNRHRCQCPKRPCSHRHSPDHRCNTTIQEDWSVGVTAIRHLTEIGGSVHKAE